MEKYYVEEILEIFEKEKNVQNSIIKNYVPEITKLFDLTNCNIQALRAIRDAVVFMNKPIKDHLNYWSKRYAHYNKERGIIMKALKEKIKNGTTNVDDMIELVENSHDTEQEIDKALDYLYG